MGNEEDQTASFTMIFSSSPVFLSSVDDFYLMSKSGRQNNLSSSLAVMETTIDLYNTDLLQHITPQSMLSWIRARLANQLAGNLDFIVLPSSNLNPCVP